MRYGSWGLLGRSYSPTISAMSKEGHGGSRTGEEGGDSLEWGRTQIPKEKALMLLPRVDLSTLRFNLEKALDVRMAMESGDVGGVAWMVQIK